MSKFDMVSADSHVVEPADLWTELIDPAFRDRAPRIVHNEEQQEDMFVCEGMRLLAPASMSGAGKSMDTPRVKTLDAVYPGAYDPQARLGEIARDGVEAEVLYPSVAMRIFAIDDRDLVRACFAAYNTWIAGFCSAYPDRFKGMAMVDLEDVEGAVTETRRAKNLGLAGLMVTVASDDPSLYRDTSFDPFWAVAEELSLSVSLHIVTNRKPIKFDMTSETLSATEVMRSLANMVFGGLFLRFPKLRVISAENDAGWAGYFLEKMDYLFSRGEGRNLNRDFAIKGKGMLPSEYVRRNAGFTFIHDRSGVEVRHWIGVENLMWSSDYPHVASTWPKSNETLGYLFAGVPDDERRLMIAGNAVREYGFE